MYSEPCDTYKMERFEKIGNAHEPLTVFGKKFIWYICDHVLNASLYSDLNCILFELGFQGSPHPDKRYSLTSLEDAFDFAV